MYFRTLVPYKTLFNAAFISIRPNFSLYIHSYVKMTFQVKHVGIPGYSIHKSKRGVFVKIFFPPLYFSVYGQNGHFTFLNM